MDRSIPEINRHIMHRMRQENRHKHKEQLRNIKPVVDNALPESMYHPIVKAKKEQMIEGKSFVKVTSISWTHSRELAYLINDCVCGF